MQLRKIILQILCINRPYVCMHGQCLLIYVEFNCQSATHMKNAIVFYYIHTTLHTLAMSHCFVHLRYEMSAEVSLPKLLEDPHSTS